MTALSGDRIFTLFQRLCVAATIASLSAFSPDWVKASSWARVKPSSSNSASGNPFRKLGGVFPSNREQYRQQAADNPPLTVAEKCIVPLSGSGSPARRGSRSRLSPFACALHSSGRAGAVFLTESTDDIILPTGSVEKDSVTSLPARCAERRPVQRGFVINPPAGSSARSTALTNASTSC